MKNFKDFYENKGPCWPGYKQVGTKTKNGKEVPNCVPEEVEEGAEKYTVKKGRYTRKVDGKTADKMKRQGWKLVAKETVAESKKIQDIVRKHKRELQKVQRSGNLELSRKAEDELSNWASSSGEIRGDDEDEFIEWLDNNLDDLIKGKIKEDVDEGKNKGESWEAGFKRRVVKTTKPEHKEDGYGWRIKGKDRPEVTIKLYKNKPDYKEFVKQMKRVAGHEFGG